MWVPQRRSSRRSSQGKASQLAAWAWDVQGCSKRFEVGRNRVGSSGEVSNGASQVLNLPQVVIRPVDRGA